MHGGIKRRASAYKALSKPGHTIILENGNLTEGIGRQAEIKAETMAEILSKIGITAINLGPAETRIGRGLTYAVDRLSRNRLISTSIPADSELELKNWIKTGPFLIGGVMSNSEPIRNSLGQKPIGLKEAATLLVDEASEEKLIPVLMLQGGRQEAIMLAREFSKLRLIIYSSSGTPPSLPEQIGNTLIITPGDKGKAFLKLVWDKHGFSGYSSIPLGPEYIDQEEAKRIYNRYLKRVEDERLLDALPRSAAPKYAGSEVCRQCHINASKIWQTSAHAHALTTLKAQGHSKDPDCVGCHVVGLDRQTGFKSKAATPELANVGCESCHGPSEKHANDPSQKTPGIAKSSCAGCHNQDHSPEFDFASYWNKIEHK